VTVVTAARQREGGGGGVAATSAWRRHRGGSSLVAVAVSEPGLWCQLGVVVVAMAAAWQQLGDSQIQKKLENPIIQIL
jgi:hypothetical protein